MLIRALSLSVMRDFRTVRFGMNSWRRLLSQTHWRPDFRARYFTDTSNAKGSGVDRKVWNTMNL